MREYQDLIRITKDTKEKIKKLAGEYGYAQVTVLEYLLSGKIKLSELYDIKEDDN